MQNKTIGFFVTIIFLMFLSLLIKITVYASPGPEGIAINSETKQCSDYWPGDEFVEYTLPEGWTAYYDDMFFSLTTAYGRCYVKEGDDYSECCKQLNLKTVDYKTIPYNQELVYLEDKYSQYAPEAVNNHLSSNCKPPYTGEMLESTGISINKETRECTALLEYNLVYELPKGGRTSTRSTYGECLLDNNWIAYPLWSNKNKERSFMTVTPYGKCSRGYGISGAKECCNNLGLTYVSEISKKEITDLGKRELPLIAQLSGSSHLSFLSIFYRIILPLIPLLILATIIFFSIRLIKRRKSLKSKEKIDKINGNNILQ